MFTTIRCSLYAALFSVSFAAEETFGAKWAGATAAEHAIAIEAGESPAVEGNTSGLSPQRPPSNEPRIYKAKISPHWFDGNKRFWYRNDLRGGKKEFVVVDVQRGVRELAFDHDRLAAALSKATEAAYTADQLPFDSIEFTDGVAAVRVHVGGTTWSCKLKSYECSKVEAEVPRPNPDSPQRPERESGSRRSAQRGPERSPVSPNGHWTAFLRDHNVFVRARDGTEIQVSNDGRDGQSYGQPSWSPDSSSLVAFRIEPGDQKQVYLVQSSPPGGGRARFQSRPYDLPGDKLTSYELNLFRLEAQAGEGTNGAWKAIKPSADRIDLGTPRVRWRSDGRSFSYTKTDRGHQRFRLFEVAAENGEVRTVIDETSETFIWTAHAENVRLNSVNWLEQSNEIIYASERDGWRHLYLVDAASGEIKNQITKGEWVVRAIDQIDEETRQIWFRASGMNRDQDPYLLHYYRVGMDGSNLVALTAGNGNHTIEYSPDREYLIDSYSRVDLAPMHELRRVADVSLVVELERADTSELEESGTPEVFVAKGRDGTTDIWGIICRPQPFDSAKKYPVIEDIYAGPQGAFVPKTFSAQRRYASLADLGFVVVKIDGMGTAHRSKAFHDVCWKNLKDAGLPDRILWHQAVAQKYPWYDITRVGIFGSSAGGQNAAGALLFYPEFYKVGVAACGCHDNRMDKASWNEQWMGYPVGPHYSECSNIDNAQRLRGKLLLIVGEMDNNVPPESTLRFADALIKAGKDFDLLFVPGGGHGMGGAYGQRRMHDFFVRHLLRTEPPDRNAN